MLLATFQVIYAMGTLGIAIWGMLVQPVLLITELFEGRIKHQQIADYVGIFIISALLVTGLVVLANTIESAAKKRGELQKSSPSHFYLILLL